MRRKEEENMKKSGFLSPRAQKNVSLTARYIIALLVTIVMVFPLFWMLSTSLKTEEEVMSAKLVFWPAVP